MTTPLRVRLALPTDLPFVHSSWHTSYWKESMRKVMDRDVYAPSMDHRIDRLLARPSTSVLVAYATDVPDEILGYAVSEYNSFHYVYVKSVYRRMGIATGLVRDRALYYTHLTPVGATFAEKMGLRYNPFLAE